MIVHGLTLDQHQVLHDVVGKQLGWKQDTIETSSGPVTGPWRHFTKGISGAIAPQYDTADIVAFNRRSGRKIKFGSRTINACKVWYCKVGDARPVWADSQFLAAKLATAGAVYDDTMSLITGLIEWRKEINEHAGYGAR